ncbi:protein of unknown function [Arachidicoccus rhizosphaerae]|uniref:DUF5013 domain-containing protein n=1 Tax=Arachidicoccus rhizosphaerae TaxID=551991 RepID=A0A1H3Y6J0_9BACT|nr:DUF4998 domain-containing protein [Arachidicoccus rhizosphaerae]SEA07289.1 protein of unknown function [Arachidicoccus rhizosphaerae]
MAVLALSTVVACSKIDDYRTEFMSGGPIIYTSKMDSVQILSGKNRVELQGLFTSDPNIVSYKVFWNGGLDSLEMPVTRSSGVDTARVIIDGLPEGQMSFEIRTYDNEGHSSVPVTETGSVYGDYYQSSLVNRGIEEAAMQDDGSALITWADVNSDAGVQNMEITYMDNNGQSHDTIIPSIIENQQTTLPDFKLGTGISYITSYIPNPTAIDTFYVEQGVHSVQADVTNLYLSNVGPGFQSATFDGRWGTLAAPWKENDAAKNKDGGTNGGFTSDSRWGYSGQLNWETWGNTPVVDGKLYQATSAPLPAGTYTITFQYYSEIQSNSSVYCIAATGDKGIPSLDGLSDALGYTLLYNGATVGATSPNLEETKSFSFTLDTPQVVTIGFLGNLVGSGDPGNYFVVGYIKLIQN